MTSRVANYITSVGVAIIAVTLFSLEFENGYFNGGSTKLSLTALSIFLSLLNVITQIYDSIKDHKDQNIIRSISARLRIKFKWKGEPYDYRVQNDLPGSMIVALQLFNKDKSLHLNFIAIRNPMFYPDGDDSAIQAIELETMVSDPLIGNITLDDLKEICGGSVRMPFYPLQRGKGSPIIQSAAAKFKINSKYDVFINPYSDETEAIASHVDTSKNHILFSFPVNGRNINWKSLVQDEPITKLKHY